MGVPQITGPWSFTRGYGYHWSVVPGAFWGWGHHVLIRGGRVVPQSGLTTGLPPPSSSPYPGPGQGIPLLIARTRTDYPPPQAGNAMDRIQSGRHASWVFSQEDFLVSLKNHHFNTRKSSCVNTRGTPPAA